MTGWHAGVFYQREVRSVGIGEKKRELNVCQQNRCLVAGTSAILVLLAFLHPIKLDGGVLTNKL